MTEPGGSAPPHRLTIPLAASSSRGAPRTGGANRTTRALHYGAVGRAGGATLILGHGAGGGQLSTFMVSYARNLSALGVDVVTFNFPYAEERRRLPDRPPVLEGCYRSVLEFVDSAVPSARLGIIIGGKSMGGRIATQIAAADGNVRIAGLVLLGYPLHPPGRPFERRDKHLPSIGRPMLFVQGSRDAFGTPHELKPALDAIEPPPVLYVVEGGDHSFKLTGANAAAQAEAHARVQGTIAEWIASVTASRRDAP